MNPIGGLGYSLNETAAKLREIVDLEKASPDEMRRWMLVGIVELNTRMAQLEKVLEQQTQTNRETQRMVLGIGALAWLGLIVGAVALARVL